MNFTFFLSTTFDSNTSLNELNFAYTGMQSLECANTVSRMNGK